MVVDWLSPYHPPDGGEKWQIITNLQQSIELNQIVQIYQASVILKLKNWFGFMSIMMNGEMKSAPLQRKNSHEVSI